MDKPITLTLRRDLSTRDWSEAGCQPGPIIPANTVVTLFAFVPAADILCDKPCGEVGGKEALNAAAKVPCPHFYSNYCDCEYACGHTGWFACWRFEVADEVLTRCRGDMTRCPSSKVRAEAKEA